MVPLTEKLPAAFVSAVKTIPFASVISTVTLVVPLQRSGSFTVWYTVPAIGKSGPEFPAWQERHARPGFIRLEPELPLVQYVFVVQTATTGGTVPASTGGVVPASLV